MSSLRAKIAERRRILFFVIAGGIAAFVNIASRIAFSSFTSFEVAIALAWVCGLTTAYLLNRLYVFGASGRAIHAEYMRFAMVNLAALVQVWLIGVGLARWLFPRVGFDWHPEALAHTIGVLVPVFTSYIAHKHFSFSRAKRLTN